MHSSGIALNITEINKVNKSLRSVADNKFGSWGNAVNAAGFNYEEIKMEKSRNKENVVADLLKRYNSGLPMYQRALIKEDVALFSACIAKFGTFKEAIEACGLDYEAIKTKRKNWSKQKIIQELKIRAKNNRPMNIASIQKDDESLYFATIRHFGSYKKAIEVCGFDYGEIKLNSSWSREKVIKNLKKRKMEGKPLSSSFLEKEENSLYTACRNYFGSYSAAIKEAGIDYEDVREDSQMIKYFGYKHEDLVGEVFKELNINFSKRLKSKALRRKYMPDFVFTNECWGDAKLSEWSIYKSDTINKYEPMCKMLTIVYLRGDPNRDEMISKKTRITSIFKYINQLSKNKRSIYLTKASQILEGIEGLENNGDLIMKLEREQVE